MSKAGYRPDIDGLRAFAILSVIGFHAFPTAVPGGFVGVDVFFVISGFLISTILYAEFRRPGATAGGVIAGFYGRRIRRIFPSLLVVLIGCYLAGYRILVPGEFTHLAQHAMAGAGFCLNLVLAREAGYFDTQSFAKPLLHLWSLGVEEQFYLLWPLLVWLAFRLRLGFRRTAVFLGALSFFWCVTKPVDAGATGENFFLPQMRFWELMVGAAAAAFYPGARAALGRTRILSNVLALAGAAFLGCSLWLVNQRMDIPNLWSLLPTAGAALVICAGEATWVARMLSHRILVWIGLISYPLYLWHWPILSFAQIYLGETGELMPKLAAIGISFLLAWATYRFVETPCRFGRALPLKTGALAGAMALVAGLCFATFRAEGFPSRFPPLIRQLSNYTYDWGEKMRSGTYFLIGIDYDERDFKRDRNEINPGKPTIYLWGDSLAADLYQGFKACFGANYNVVQRTVAGTPPFLGVDVPGLHNAKRINQWIFDSIRKDRPEVVVLSANWQLWTWREVGATLSGLKALGIRRIVLVGPKPDWAGTLRQQLFNWSRRHGFRSVPTRLKTGVNPRIFELDREMAAFAERYGVEYESPCRILGGSEGLLTRVGDTPDTLIAFDNIHFTQAGAVYFVSHFPGAEGSGRR